MPRYEFDPETMEVPPDGEVRYTKKGTPWVYRPPKPYEAGNLESVRHGGYSPRLISHEASEVHEALMGAFPFVTSWDMGAVDVWCRETAHYHLLYDGVQKVVEEEGVLAVPQKLWDDVRKAAASVMKATDALGLSPTSRMRLMRDAGFAKQLAGRSVKDLISSGAELRRIK